ncbi:MAG: hypothetical protein WC768_02585 [Patescibacteria group bacterium]|jgi:rubrerythrin
MKNDREILIKMFDDLYLWEKQAKDLYDDYLKTLKDKKEVEIIRGIRDDELRHMQIVKNLHNLVE